MAAAFLSAAAYSERAADWGGGAAVAGSEPLARAWEDVRASLDEWEYLDDAATDAQAVCCTRKRGKTAYVAFRGTSGVRDALADVCLSKTPLSSAGITGPPGCPPRLRAALGAARAHCGFLTQYCGVRDAVRAYVAARPGHRVVFTGHSLGGALATVAALDWKASAPSVDSRAVVFGSPRVGDGSFCEAVRLAEAPVRRYEYLSDPVCSLPLRVRWMHCGDCVRLSGPPEFAAERGPGDHLGNALWIPGILGARDHEMKSYLVATVSAALRGSAPGGRPAAPRWPLSWIVGAGRALLPRLSRCI